MHQTNPEHKSLLPSTDLSSNKAASTPKIELVEKSLRGIEGINLTAGSVDVETTVTVHMGNYGSHIHCGSCNPANCSNADNETACGSRRLKIEARSSGLSG